MCNKTMFFWVPFANLFADYRELTPFYFSSFRPFRCHQRTFFLITRGNYTVPRKKFLKTRTLCIICASGLLKCRARFHQELGILKHTPLVLVNSLLVLSTVNKILCSWKFYVTALTHYFKTFVNKKLLVCKKLWKNCVLYIVVPVISYVNITSVKFLYVRRYKLKVWDCQEIFY